MNPQLILFAIRNRKTLWRWAKRLIAINIVMGVGFLGLVVVTFMVLTNSAQTANASHQHVVGIPDVMLAAYVNAARRTPALAPQCQGMRWQIPAGIAAVESHHAAGHDVAGNGDVTPRILGPLLDGSGVGENTTPVRNPDGSAARAEGPFQFLSSTWATAGRDGNDDGVRDANNAFDAALGAAIYLCGPSHRDLGDRTQLRAAIYTYNHSPAYADQVLSYIDTYDAMGISDPTTVNCTGGGAASSPAQVVVCAAMAEQGVPYAWGGGTADGPSRGISDGGGDADAHGDYLKVGFDCSGLTVYAFAKAGIALPRTAADQFARGTRIPREAGLAGLQPGDLIFYSPGVIHHVGIYIGNGKIINAPYSGTVVRVDILDLSQYAGGSRLLP